MTWKTVKKWQKLIINSGVKMWSNLTTKRGDSGSAGMLGEKCVMIWAPNLDTKIDQKWCQQQKLTKKWQKKTKSENHQNQENQKKWKSDKMQKIKIIKKVKNAKLKKWKKCQKSSKMVKTHS